MPANRTRWVRLVATSALLAALGVTLLLAMSSGDGGHELTIVTADATGIRAGDAVRAAGKQVGAVESTTLDPQRRARLKLRLDDDVWPLPRDTTIQMRLGGTIKYTDRYLDLRRGHAGGRPIPEGGVLPSANYRPAVNFDQVFATFDKPTRADLKAMLDEGGPAFLNAVPQLRRTLEETPPALVQASAVLDDLGADEHGLDTLVRSADSVVNAVDRSTPGVNDLVTGASITFDSIAQHATSLRTLLEEAPGTLVATRSTLGRADRTLAAVRDLSRRVSPGVTEVRRLAAPLNEVLRTLVSVGPEARGTLAALRTAAPDLNQLLDRAKPLMPHFESIGREGAKQFACIRPYSPEIAGLAATWGPGGWGRGDGKDKYMRAEVGGYTFGNSNTQSTAQVVATHPGLKVAFPQPPGYIGGRPWFLPECGITEDVFDPAKDPESQATELYPAGFIDRRQPDPEAGKP